MNLSQVTVNLGASLSQHCSWIHCIKIFTREGVKGGLNGVRKWSSELDESPGGIGIVFPLLEGGPLLGGPPLGDNHSSCLPSSSVIDDRTTERSSGTRAKITPTTLYVTPFNIN